MSAAEVGDRYLCFVVVKRGRGWISVWEDPE